MKTAKIFTAFVVALAMSFALTNRSMAQTTIKPQEKPIEWQTNLFAAYKQSLTERKPLVVFFYVYSGNYSTQFAKEVLYTARMNSLVGRAIFARVDVETDDAYNNVSRMIKSLGLKEYPVVSVMDTWEDKIVERGHITGFHNSDNFYTLLNNLLLKNAAISKR